MPLGQGRFQACPLTPEGSGSCTQAAFSRWNHHPEHRASAYTAGENAHQSNRSGGRRQLPVKLNSHVTCDLGRPSETRKLTCTRNPVYEQSQQWDSSQPSMETSPRPSTRGRFRELRDRRAVEQSAAVKSGTADVRHNSRGPQAACLVVVFFFFFFFLF